MQNLFMPQISPNQFNSSDGVRFEPFNKNMLENPIPFDTNKIKNLIQDEYNAEVFYTKLETNSMDKILVEIKNNCRYRQNLLREIYSTYSSDLFEVKEIKINLPGNFKAAINYAIYEENSNLQNLLRLSNEIANSDINKKINYIAQLKLLDINYLIWLAIS